MLGGSLQRPPINANRGGLPDQFSDGIANDDGIAHVAFKGCQGQSHCIKVGLATVTQGKHGRRSGINSHRKINANRLDEIAKIQHSRAA